MKNNRVLSIRLSKDTLKNVDRFRKQLENRGICIGRGEAIRVLLRTGLKNYQ